MEAVLLIARFLLAAVFGIAGIAKVADLDGSRKAFTGFGVPDKLASALGYSLPFIEILVAVALIPLTTAWFGAIVALALLVIFVAGITVSLARGQSPDCHCFGQLHSAPVGWTTFARNIMLAAVAGFVVVWGKDNAGLSALSWLGDLKIVEVVNLVFGLVAVALLATAVVYLRRVLSQQARVLERVEAMKKVIDEDYAEPPVEREEALPPVEGLPVGAPAPSFSLATVGGEQVTLADLLAYGKPVLLFFVSPNCAPCKTLLPLVKGWERDYDDKLTIALISKGDLKDTISHIAGYEARHLLLQGDSRIHAQFGAQWTPSAVLISVDSRIASQIAYGDEGVRGLVTDAVTATDAKRKRSLPVKRNGHKPQLIIGKPNALRDFGEKAHSFSLPDINGGVVNTKDLLGRDTLLLFWEPKCPYCQSIAEDLIELEEQPPKGAPRFVFISSGNEDDVRAESRRFKSQFLYDPKLEVGVLFGTNLTPSAVLIDSKGRIASAPTAGRPDILALIGVRNAVQPIAAGG